MKTRPAILLLSSLTLLSCAGSSGDVSSQNISISSQNPSQSSVLSSEGTSEAPAVSSSSVDSSEVSSAEPSTTSSQSEPASSSSSAQPSSFSEQTNSESSSSSEASSGPVTGLSFNAQEYDVKIGKKLYLTVDFTPTDLSIDDKEVEWSSSDASVASIDQYGRVTGVKEGHVLITCRSLHGDAEARCTVYVVNGDASYKKQWLKVDDPTTLAPGDLLTIACPEENKVATLENVGMYLHPTAATFSSDKSEITSLPSEAGTYILDGSHNNWTLESQEGMYLATTNEKKVTFVKNKGNIHWAFTKEEGYLYMESTSNVRGWMMYNAKNSRFATYESNVQVDMFTITLYKQVKRSR